MLACNIKIAKLERAQARAGKDPGLFRQLIKRELSIRQGMIRAEILHYHATGKTYRTLA